MQTALDKAMATVGADGSVSKQTALDVFAAAVGPLPGVPAAAKPQVAYSSGTLAVQWILRYWAQLTPAQQSAAKAAFTSTGGIGGGGMAGPLEKAPPGSPDIDCQTADSADAGPYRPQLDAAITAIAAHRGPLKLKTTLQVNKTNLWQPSTMYTFACRGGKVAADTGAAPDSCTIHINPKAFTSFSASDRAKFLIHESMHCFLYATFGLRYETAPAWLVEGVPTWVQGTIGGGDAKTEEHWTTYLAVDKRPLFARTYDAIGYFAHLAETGTDVWTRIDPMFTAFFSGGNAAAYTAAAPGADFLATWASSYARGRHPGQQWDTSGAGRPDYRAAIATFAVANAAHGSFTAPATATYLVATDLQADVVEFGASAGSTGRFGASDGSDRPLSAVAGQDFCTKAGGCACPAGSAGAGDQLKPLARGPGYLALSGGLSAASVTVTGTSLGDFCAKPRTACMVGTWTSQAFDIAVTGPTGLTEHGGAGVVLKIAASGASSVNFTPMQPIVFSSKQAGGWVRYDGTATGTVRPQQIMAATGQWLPSNGDFSHITATVAVTRPMTMTIFDHKPLSQLVSLAQGLSGGVSSTPIFGNGGYSCTPTTLTLTPPHGSAVTGTWTLRRSGS